MLTMMYFSPTRTTKKIVSAIGKTFFEKMLCKTNIVDLTPLVARMRTYSFCEEDVVIFGAPVYAGRIPPLLLPILRQVNGNGARAVVVSVYGNRAFDDALLETFDLFTEQGFTVCAAGAFIGEHSYSKAVAGNRPDVEDLLAADLFATVAYEKVKSGTPVRSLIEGNRPYKEYAPSVLSARKAPVVDAALCVHCGKCIEVCPVCTIAADLSDRGQCIGCAACVKFCPRQARAFDGEDMQRLRMRLEETCRERKNPKFFV